MLYCSNICMKFSTFFWQTDANTCVVFLSFWLRWETAKLSHLEFWCSTLPQSLYTTAHACTYVRSSVNMVHQHVSGVGKVIGALACSWCCAFVWNLQGARSSVFLTGHTQTARKKVSKVHSGPGITEGRGFAVVAGLWSWALFLTEIATTTMCASRTS
jgi:hypothetical protein